jgi:ligand-binding SRPBCC domain-containing protein
VPRFSFSFIVNAPLEVVAAFHQDTRVLEKLTPFPVIARIHEYEPLADGSKAKFTLWFGPVPVRWHAIHSDVGLDGFTDTQVSGPLKYWRHVHRFNVEGEDNTRVEEDITFEHDKGLRGLFSRLLFNKPGLYALFTARKIITRRAVVRSVAVQEAEKTRQSL